MYIAQAHACTCVCVYNSVFFWTASACTFRIVLYLSVMILVNYELLNLFFPLLCPLHPRNTKLSGLNWKACTAKEFSKWGSIKQTNFPLHVFNQEIVPHRTLCIFIEVKLVLFLGQNIKWQMLTILIPDASDGQDLWPKYC